MAVNQHESRGSITFWIKAAFFSHETLSRLLRNKFNRWETRKINHFPIVFFFFLSFICWQHCTKYSGIIGWRCWCFTVFKHFMAFIPHHSRHHEMVGFSIFSAGGGSHLFTPPFPLTPSAMWLNNFAGRVEEHSNIKVLQWDIRRLCEVDMLFCARK